eukprot:8871889-Pyramimonas_sp.AAC.1
MRPTSLQHFSGSLNRAAVVASSESAATAWRRSARVARSALTERCRARACAVRSTPIGTRWPANRVAHRMAYCFR